MRLLISVVGALLFASCASRSVSPPLTGSSFSPYHPCNPDFAAAHDYTCLDVHFGTNRNKEWRVVVVRDPEQDDRFRDVGKMFGVAPERKDCEPNSQRFRDAVETADACHLGRVSVAIPQARRSGAIKSHPAGGLVPPDQIDKKFWTPEYVTYEGSAAKRREMFRDAVRAELAGDDTVRHAFVYVHGFNVTFRNAVFRTAQLKFDTGLDGPALLYSWPANGRTFDYFSDQVDGDLSVDGLIQFLNLAHDALVCAPDEAGDCTDGETKLHVVAHSMGARITAQALGRMASAESPRKFGKVIFAAGDVDTELFREWIGVALPNVEAVTIYTSRHDGAVEISRLLRNLDRLVSKRDPIDPKVRLGFFPKKEAPFVFKADGSEATRRVDTVDISALSKKSFWGMLDFTRYFVRSHNKYAENFLVSDDMLRFLCESTPRPPGERSTYLVPQTNEETGRTHWRLESPEDYDFESERRGCVGLME